MNVIIIAHERSLNKAEGLLNAYRAHNVTLVVDNEPDISLKPYVQDARKVLVVKGFELLNIVNRVPKCDKVWCISENLLPLQSQLESHYGIDNINPFAAEVLSNKQRLDDYCRLIGLSEYVPMSVTPTFHSQLDIFKNKELFTKPDIGTGSNPSFFGNELNVEYRRWNNKHHFLQNLKDKNKHNDFFSSNKKGIYTQRFNYKPCKIMVQEYFWSEEPSLIPVGVVRNGIVNNLCYLKTTKVKYGEQLDANKNPVELHSNSRTSDIAKDLAVWIVSNDEIDKDRHNKMQHFLQTLITNLQIKDLIFTGPDFHVNNDRLLAIDFNPRPGQFMNILDKVNDYKLFENIVANKEVTIDNQLLWGCTMLKPGTITELSGVNKINKYLNAQNTELATGITIPKFQNLQNKAFNVNLDIVGKNEQELFNKYKQVNQLLQNCITY